MCGNANEELVPPVDDRDLDAVILPEPVLQRMPLPGFADSIDL